MADGPTRRVCVASPAGGILNPETAPPPRGIPHDAVLYRQRHHIENMFGKLKDWRRIHPRYDRCAHTFFSAIAIAATVIFWLGRQWVRCLIIRSKHHCENALSCARCFALTELAFSENALSSASIRVVSSLSLHYNEACRGPSRMTPAPEKVPANRVCSGRLPLRADWWLRIFPL